MAGKKLIKCAIKPEQWADDEYLIYNSEFNGKNVRSMSIDPEASTYSYVFFKRSEMSVISQKEGMITLVAREVPPITIPIVIEIEEDSDV